MVESVLNLSLIKDGDVVTVAVAGEIDRDSSGKLMEAVRLALGGGACSLFMLDLLSVTFMDCSGLAALIEANSECERSGVTFKIEGVSPCVSRLLELTDLDGVLPVSLVAYGA